MRIAYLDPPYSRYFHRLAGVLAGPGEPPIALLSSPAYRLYTGDDRVEVWPADQGRGRAKLPKELLRISRTQSADPRFSGVYAHAIAWFRECFVRERIEVCFVYSDMRVFSAAAQQAAAELGVVCLYFERGAFRYRTASLSTYGLNGRFPLQQAVAQDPLRGLPVDDRLPRRASEPWLKLRFAQFLLRNGTANLASPLRRLLRPRHQQLGHYVRLGLKQWAVQWRQRTTRTKPPGPPEERPIVFLPLQLSADTQLVLYSPFASNQALIDFVVEQTRRVAPRAEVWIKTHPMDLTDYRVPAGARLVHDGTPRLIHLARAVVTINSTVGFEAAVAGRPVLCFGASFYAQSAAVAMVRKANFAGRLRALLDAPPEPALGPALRRDVLRCYQSPGDVWAYSVEDLLRTADIVRQHVEAARAEAALPAAARARPQPVPETLPSARKAAAKRAAGAAPVAKKPAAAKPAGAKKPEAKKPERKKPEAKKPEAKKPEMTKPAPKQPAAKGPAANKPGANEPAGPTAAAATPEASQDRQTPAPQSATPLV